MTGNRVIVVRYAQAFLNYCRATCGQKKALEDTLAVRDILRANPDFVSLLENPEIAYLEKCSVIDAAIKDGINEDIRNFLKLLLEKKRFNLFPDIAEYLRGKYRNEGQAEVLLRTAFPLDLELIERMQNALKEKFGQNLKFYIELDGSILGGVQVVMENKIIDGSVKRRLSELRKDLTAAEFN